MSCPKTVPAMSVASLNYSDRLETNLVTLEIDSMDKVHAIFGEKTVKGFTPLVLLPKKFSGFYSFFSIPHGFDCIISKNGSIQGILRPGIPYHFGVKSCPTKDNVRIDIYVDFLLTVTNSVDFISKISAENMEELLRATEAESVRSLVRTVRVDQALDLRGMNCDDMLATLNDKMNPYGITIEHVTIANVILPSDVTTRLQNTTTLGSKEKLQNKQQQLSLLKLQGNQTKENTEQQRKNEVSKTQELAKKNTQMINLEIEALKSKFASDSDMIRVEKESKISKMLAERSAALGVINRERETAVVDIKENGKIEARKIEMEADKYVVKVQTETNLKIAENRAKIVKIKAETEDYCSKRNVGNKREFCIKKSRLEIIKKMGGNQSIVICGEGSKDVMSLMFSSSKISSELGIKTKK